MSDWQNSEEGKLRHLLSVLISRYLSKEVEAGASLDHLQEESGKFVKALKVVLDEVLYDKGELRSHWGMINVLRQLQTEMETEKRGAKARMRA